MYCAYCGKQVVEGSRFCEYCGEPLVETDPDFGPDQTENTGASGDTGTNQGTGAFGGAGISGETGASYDAGTNRGTGASYGVGTGGETVTPGTGGDPEGPEDDIQEFGEKKDNLLRVVITVIVLAVIVIIVLLILKKKELLFFADGDESAAISEEISEETPENETGETEETSDVEEETVTAVLSLSDTKVTLSEVGETYQLTVTEDSISLSEVEWFSSDKTVVTVDESGVVTAVAAGETTVIAQWDTQRVTCLIVCELEDTEIHSYQLVIDDVTWYEAQEACTDAGGYLVNINSEEEFDAIIEEIGNQELTDKIFFLGAMRTIDSESYFWVNESGALYGDPLNANEDAWCNDVWLTDEPSFADGDTQETVVTMFYSSSEKQWVLNDVPVDILEAVSYYSGKIGYICEIEE